MKNYHDVGQLTDVQIEMLNGWLLSDGYLSKPENSNSNSSFRLSQSKFPTNKPERTEIVKWTFDELQPFSSRFADSVRNDKRGIIKSGIVVFMATKRNPIFTELRHKWYKDYKIVPRDLKLTPLTVACWSQGDGINRPNKRAYAFCTDSFTVDDNEFLADLLAKTIGIQARVGPRNRVSISGDANYIALIEYIKDHIKPCFAYKCSLDGYKILAGDNRPDVKIRESQGHYDWIVNKRSTGLTTEEIAAEFTKEFDIEIDRASIANVLKKLNPSDQPLHKGYKRKSVSVERQISSMRLQNRNGKLKGIHRSRNRFEGIIWQKDKSIKLGWFDTPEEAARNYDYHVLRLFDKGTRYINYPDFDYSNFVPLKESPEMKYDKEM